MPTQELATFSQQLTLNPKLRAVKGLGELADDAIQALSDCLQSGDESVKFAAAKYVMEKLVTPKATHTFIDPAIAVLYEANDQSFCENMIQACRDGGISIEECHTMLDMKKAHTDISKHQAVLDQISRIRDLEARKATLIVVKSGREQLEEALK